MAWPLLLDVGVPIVAVSPALTAAHRPFGRVSHLSGSDCIPTMFTILGAPDVVCHTLHVRLASQSLCTYPDSRLFTSVTQYLLLSLMTRRRKPKAAVEANASEGDSAAPEPIDNRLWATGLKLKFLESHVDDWRLLDQGKSVGTRYATGISSFYTNVTLTWLYMWGWDLPMEQDGHPLAENPTAEELKNVLQYANLAPEEATRRQKFYRVARDVSVYCRARPQHERSLTVCAFSATAALVPTSREEVVEGRQGRPPLEDSWRLHRREHQGSASQ